MYFQNISTQLKFGPKTFSKLAFYTFMVLIAKSYSKAPVDQINKQDIERINEQILSLPIAQDLSKRIQTVLHEKPNVSPFLWNSSFGSEYSLAKNFKEYIIDIFHEEFTKEKMNEKRKERFENFCKALAYVFFGETDLHLAKFIICTAVINTDFFKCESSIYKSDLKSANGFILIQEKFEFTKLLKFIQENNVNEKKSMENVYTDLIVKHMIIDIAYSSPQKLNESSLNSYICQCLYIYEILSKEEFEFLVFDNEYVIRKLSKIFFYGKKIANIARYMESYEIKMRSYLEKIPDRFDVIFPLDISIQ